VSRSRQTRSRIAVATPWLALSLLAAVLVPSGSARAPSVAKGGGTLRVAIFVDPGTIEPGTTAGEQSRQLMYATQLTLVTYREDWGRPGTGRRIIPYGAQMPTLSGDSKTYTFRIRPGLQFSDGSPVTARNFQAGFERVLDPRMRGQWGMLFANVVGAPAFMQGRSANVSGVKATKDRLVFHLAKAQPDFLSLLALHHVSAMPLHLPFVPGGVDAPLPSAGPYYVEEYVPRRTLRMVRNLHWKPSTLPSRPAYFQEIEYLERATAEAAVTAVRRGEADVATVHDTRDLNPDLIRELEDRYGVNVRQFWVRPRTRRYSLVFNTRRAKLFQNARLRRAVSFALDRKQLLHTLGPLAGQVTDQLLLPISAGFREWKLYPSRPDLPSAKRLARGALRGRDATLIVGSTGSGPGVGNVIKSNLAQIGLNVEVVPKPPIIFLDYLRNPDNPWDLATMSPQPGRVDPMVFINHGLEGHRYDFIPNPSAFPGFYNYSGFDDEKWVRRMRRTNSLRHGRLKAYALLDRDLMRKAAPVAPYATGNSLTLVSPRIGCFKSSAYPSYLAPNLAALCRR
jgi:peptide/nickel transport system substrate-binding protein